MLKPVLVILVLLTLLNISAHAQKSKTSKPGEMPCAGLPIYSGREMSEEKRQRVIDLASNLIGIKRRLPVSQQQKDAIRRDLIALADDDMESEEALIGRLVDNLVKALSQGRKNDNARTEIAYALEIILNVPLYTSSTGPARSHVQIMFEQMRITESAWLTVLSDLNAVVGRGIEKMDKKNGVNRTKPNISFNRTRNRAALSCSS